MNYRLLTLTLAAVLALADRASAEAYVINYVSNFERVDGVDPDNGSEDHNTSQAHAFPSDSFSFSGPNLSTFTYAGMGVLDNVLMIDVTSSPGHSNNGSSSLQIQWVDNLTISAPGMDGLTGTVTAQMRLNGSVTNSGNENFSFSFGFYLGAASTGTGQIFTNAQLPRIFDNELYTLSLPFTFGTPFQVRGAISNFGGKTAIDGTSFYYHGDAHANWQGITSVVDASSAPVTAFTVTAESGVNYIGVVPEPSAWLALGVGGCVLLLQRPRWRRAF